MENWKLRIDDLQRLTAEGRATPQDFFRLLGETDEDTRRAQAKPLGKLNRDIFFATHRVFPLNAGILMEAAVLMFGVFAGIRSLSTGIGYLLFIAQIFTVISLHPLFHILAGKFIGIRFLGFYFNGPLKIEPGLKVDYETFLLRTRNERAIFFLSGILGTTVAAWAWVVVSFIYPSGDLTWLAVLAIALILLLSEFLPLLFIKVGYPRLLGFSWRRADLYKALREWKR